MSRALAELLLSIAHKALRWCQCKSTTLAYLFAYTVHLLPARFTMLPRCPRASCLGNLVHLQAGTPEKRSRQLQVATSKRTVTSMQDCRINVQFMGC